MKPTVTKYQLENDSSVEVHKVFGDDYYFAIVDLDGRYPERDKIAHDIHRNEYIYLLEGNLTVNKNGKSYQLDKGESILIEDGDKYSITGTGKALVFVKDEEGGESAIETSVKGLLNLPAGK